MFRNQDPQYDLRKPPIILSRQQVEFTCTECGRLGLGTPETKVHTGKCRAARTAKLAKRSAEKRARRNTISLGPVEAVC